MARMTSNATGSSTASSFDSIAAKASSAAAAGRLFAAAMAASTAKSVSSSAVRPLIHNRAMLIPWKFINQTPAANRQAPAGSCRTRARQAMATAVNRASARLVSP